ncbi:flagellar hook-basal body complex protein FliE [Paenibacillus sp. JCM 10914]|uniref:flagellar hook-basal body complex protein FliE n=1 Tax=Paenibacillus sp. JCM 10914 TaxID=1236974 RepID=UPI0003CC47BA|nr:flagellar hook-basal body complex protein FliE [Paenibacillus sp. JCM 10914]GAE04770.1 flagellar hook-basal body complex protein FliE [Paenibacillus sp. JCM 10914]
MINNTIFSVPGAQGVQGVQPIQLQQQVNTETTPSDSIREFSSYLNEALNSVATQEQNAHVMSDKLMIGQVNVDQAMISAQQALLSIQLTTQVRNKVVEAYQEIMRTQI